MTAGCSLWTRIAHRAADNGVFFGFLSESECTAACLTYLNCVAVDLGPHGCVLHNKIEDLATAYYAPGVRQYILNRQCLPTTPLPTTNTTTMTVENYTTSTGIHISFLHIWNIFNF